MKTLEIKAPSVKEAWDLADRLFCTGYEMDKEKSEKSGIPIYRSSMKNLGYYISDFGNKIVLTHENGDTETIWIDSPAKRSEPLGLSCKVFITDSYEAASLLALGFSKHSDFANQVRSSYGSTMCADLEFIPDIYKKPGKFYAMIAYREKEGRVPQYNLTVC